MFELLQQINTNEGIFYRVIIAVETERELKYEIDKRRQRLEKFFVCHSDQPGMLYSASKFLQ